MEGGEGEEEHTLTTIEDLINKIKDLEIDYDIQQSNIAIKDLTDKLKSITIQGLSKFPPIIHCTIRKWSDYSHEKIVSGEIVFIYKNESFNAYDTQTVINVNKFNEILREVYYNKDKLDADKSKIYDDSTEIASKWSLFGIVRHVFNPDNSDTFGSNSLTNHRILTVTTGNYPDKSPLRTFNYWQGDNIKKGQTLCLTLNKMVSMKNNIIKYEYFHIEPTVLENNTIPSYIDKYGGRVFAHTWVIGTVREIYPDDPSVITINALFDIK